MQVLFSGGAGAVNTLSAASNAFYFSKKNPIVNSRRRQAAWLCAGLRAPPWGADGQTGARGPMPRSGKAPVGWAGANW